MTDGNTHTYELDKGIDFTFKTSHREETNMEVEMEGTYQKGREYYSTPHFDLTYVKRMEIL